MTESITSAALPVPADVPANASADGPTDAPTDEPADALIRQARPMRYAVSCDEVGWLRQMPAPKTFSQRLFGPLLSSRTASSASGHSDAGGGVSATPPLSPISSGASSAGHQAGQAGQGRASRAESAEDGRDGVYRFFKLRGSSLGMYADEGGAALVRAPVKGLVDADEAAMRITLRLSPAKDGGRGAPAGAGEGGAVGERGPWPSMLILGCDTLAEFTRWSAAFEKAASSSFEMHYKKLGCVGKGHFSTVFLVADRATGEKFACKVIKKDPKEIEKSRKFIRREVKVLSVTSHPNIVCAVDIFSYRNKPHILLELLPHGSLKDLIVKRVRIPEGEARHIFAGILKGVAYLHSRRIVHRDVKPENVLLGGEPRIGGWIPQLTDFGLSTFLGDHDKIYSTVGTPNYVSPELCAGIPYGTGVDVWSSGVLLFYMLSGERPFQGETRSSIKASILRGLTSFPEEGFRRVGNLAKGLIRLMLDMDQSTRISAEDALKHDWFKTN